MCLVYIQKVSCEQIQPSSRQNLIMGLLQNKIQFHKIIQTKEKTNKNLCNLFGKDFSCFRKLCCAFSRLFIDYLTANTILFGRARNFFLFCFLFECYFFVYTKIRFVIWGLNRAYLLNEYNLIRLTRTCLSKAVRHKMMVYI